MNKIEDYRVFVGEVLNRYSPVSDTVLSLFMSICRVEEFKKGARLLDIGMISRRKYILCSGTVVAYFINEEGDLYHKNIFLEGDFVGSTVSALRQKASDFALEAIEDAKLIGFDYEKYRQLIEEQSEMKAFYIAYLEKNWVLDKEQRELDIVLKDAEARYQDFIAAHQGIEQRIPLHYIASHLGITPTQLSRIRKKLKK